MKFCKKFVMPNTKPDLHFDEELLKRVKVSYFI